MLVVAFCAECERTVYLTEDQDIFVCPVCSQPLVPQENLGPDMRDRRSQP